MNKKLFSSVILVMVLVFVISCGNMGGTIIIEYDQNSNAWGVAIGSSSTRSESDTVTIYPG
jgi:uncharacterized protein YuzE